MEQVETLAEIVGRLDALDREATIYAAEPWTLDAQALVAREPKDGGLPVEARDAGLTYFLEVSIARDLAEDLAVPPDARQPPSLCDRLIRYAIHDA